MQKRCSFEGEMLAGVLDISEPTRSVYNDICRALRMRRGGCKMATCSGQTVTCFISSVSEDVAIQGDCLSNKVRFNIIHGHWNS